MLVSALEVAALCGAAPGVAAEIDVAAAHTGTLIEQWGPDSAEDSLAKTIARGLHGTIPMIMGSALTAPIAYRWKTQINENAKMPAFNHELPELDHNELVGWGGAAEVGTFSAVFLDDCDIHPRVKSRIELTEQAVAGVARETFRVQTRGETTVERVISLVLLGDLVALYMAILRGIDPSPVPAIDALKQALGDQIAVQGWLRRVPGPGPMPSDVVAQLDAALAGCLTGEFGAMVTAPVQKSVINDAGIAFSGHTEFLAERTGSKVVMMLVGATASGPLRVALATTHIALSAVPAAITGDLLTRTVRIVADELASKFRIATPRIAVCGLNPHAGERGYLGREEIETIAPALDALRDQGIDVAGPLPADTVFVPAKASQFDCVIALYHDQGLPVLKHASFGHGVNVTLGLPLVRTSVDHGTALDLAADGAGASSVDPGSMFAAVELAIELSQSRPHSA